MHHDFISTNFIAAAVAPFETPYQRKVEGKDETVNEHDQRKCSPYGC